MDRNTQAVVEQYADGLVQVAIDNDQIAEIQEEVSSLLAVSQETGLVEYLSSLAISHSDKEKLIEVLQEQASRYVKNFLAVILQNEREGLLEYMFQAVLDKLTHLTRDFDLTVTTAVTLTDNQRQGLLALGNRKFGIQAKSLVEKLDARIIGGFILEANHQTIDTSIRSQLQQLKNNLK